MAVSIDLGLKDGMVLSTGSKVENSGVFARYEASLVVAQRANKARRVAAIHAKIANTRKAFLHTISAAPSGMPERLYRPLKRRRHVRSWPLAAQTAGRCLSSLFSDISP